jgi:hypothetical protein
MAAPKPTGLLPREVTALRESSGADAQAFADAFGVSANVVERWESLGVPGGPTALAIRFVADSMEFEFPEQEADATTPCRVCGAPASQAIHGLHVCPPCFRDPVKSMEALGFDVTRSQNHVTGFRTIDVRLPSGKEMGFVGHFISEGLGTMLTKLFKNEPQLGDKSWDDAVYVQWIEPGLDALSSPGTREIIKTLVAYGMVEVYAGNIEVEYGSAAAFDEEIVLLCGLLANEQQ